MKKNLRGWKSNMSTFIKATESEIDFLTVVVEKNRECERGWRGCGGERRKRVGRDDHKMIFAWSSVSAVKKIINN